MNSPMTGLGQDGDSASETASAPQPGQTTAFRGLSRALHALEAVAEQPMRPIELCERLGLPWTTVHRMLAQLTAQGFVEKEPDSGRYRVGQASWLVGSAYTVNHRVLDAARPHLEMLAGGVNAVVQLCERAGGLALTLFSHHRSDSENIMKTTYGYQFPLHCGAKGQVLLAYAAPEFVEAYLAGSLEQLTPATVTEPMRLRELLAQIREQGYARTESDVQIFTGSVAAPLFDRDGRVPASICLIMRASELSHQSVTAAATEELLAVAGTISAGLGWRPGAEQTIHSTQGVQSPRARPR
jgi:DNA-binding IclR family transcriptional regulator